MVPIRTPSTRRENVPINAMEAMVTSSIARTLRTICGMFKAISPFLELRCSRPGRPVIYWGPSTFWPS